MSDVFGLKRDSRLGSAVEFFAVDKVTDHREIASFTTPALAVDDRVILAGRVPPADDVVDLIQDAMS